MEIDAVDWVQLIVPFFFLDLLFFLLYLLLLWSVEFTGLQVPEAHLVPLPDELYLLWLSCLRLHRLFISRQVDLLLTVLILIRLVFLLDEGERGPHGGHRFVQVELIQHLTTFLLENTNITIHT